MMRLEKFSKIADIIDICSLETAGKKDIKDKWFVRNVSKIKNEN